MIHSFDYCVKHIREVGSVVSSGEYLVAVDGLPGAVVGEGVTFEGDIHGRVMNIREGALDVLIFSRQPLPVGTKAARTGSMLLLTCGDGLLGHVVTTLGHILSMHRARSYPPESRPIESDPMGIVGRAKISRFFATGTTIVDTLIPLGHGQRELVIGDRKTGKTHFLLTTVCTQAALGTIIVYCAIGKRKTEIKSMEKFFRSHGVMDQCVIVAADASESPANIIYAPFAAMTIAEYFRDTGRDSLVIFDDLSTHAKTYREVALVMGTFPGRESYPGDIFAVHSRLLERAGCFLQMQKAKGKRQNDVAITCLPVVESIGGDITGYIQTNIMSMTDGHIFFNSDLFAAGRRPPIDVFLSVSRVGRQTQTALQRDSYHEIIGMLKAYDNAQRYLRFGSEMSNETKRTIALGDGLWRLFTQMQHDGLKSSLQGILIALLWMGRWDGSEANKLAAEISKGLGGRIEKLISQSDSLKALIQRVGKILPKNLL